MRFARRDDRRAKRCDRINALLWPVGRRSIPAAAPTAAAAARRAAAGPTAGLAGAAGGSAPAGIALAGRALAAAPARADAFARAGAYHDLDGAADAQCPVVVCPIRAESHLRAHP